MIPNVPKGFSMLQLCLTIALLIGACATPQPPLTMPPVPIPPVTDPIPDPVTQLSQLQDFQLRFHAVNEGNHHGVPVIGTNARFSLILIFARPLPSEIKPAMFEARIGTLRFPFSRQNTGKEFFTRELRIGQPRLAFGPVEIAIYYRPTEGPHGSELLLGRRQPLMVDTTPPVAPVLHLKGCHKAHFTLSWENPTDDVMEYIIQKQTYGQWVKVPPGAVKTPPLRIQDPDAGRIRIVAVDWAKNRTESNDIELRCEKKPLQVTHLKILAPVANTTHINDRVVTGRDTLGHAYAVEVTANRPARLLLVNVDALGYGYRLYPTPCRTGRHFNDRLQPSVPIRYPNNHQDGYFYLGLDQTTGTEEIYAVLYEDEAVRSQIWQWVQNEICGDDAGGSFLGTPKGTVELPGPGAHGKKQVDRFEAKLKALHQQHVDSMAWAKTSFWHH